MIVKLKRQITTMNYLLISEYIEAIKNAEDNFEQLKNLRPILGEDGEPVMTSGNFATESGQRSLLPYTGIMYVSFMNGSGQTYIPLSKQSKLAVGDEVDLKRLRFLL